MIYQNINTRWHSGAGIFRDITYINTSKNYLISDGVYLSEIPEDEERLDGKWIIKISIEVAGEKEDYEIIHIKCTKDANEFAQFEG